MASVQQLSSTGRRDVICTLCLDNCSPNTTTKYLFFQEIFQYLGLDIQQLFNVERGFLFPFGDVDIEVLVCKRCRGRMELFHVIHTKYESFQRKLNASVKEIHDIMVNGKGNYVGTPREYLVGQEPRETSTLERFLRPIAQGSRTLLTMTTGDTKTSNWENANRATFEETEYNAALHKEQFAGQNAIENLNTEKPIFWRGCGSIPLPWKDDVAVNIMKRSPIADNRAGTSARYEEIGLLSGVSDVSMQLFASNGVVLAGPSSSSAHPSANNPTWTNGRSRANKEYECNICGKIVVSLKNFESHQWIHLNLKPYECNYCEQTSFRDISGLRCHFLRQHRHLMFAEFRKSNISVAQFQAGLDFLIYSLLTRLPVANRKAKAEGCRVCNHYYTLRIAVEDHIVQRHYDVLANGIEELQEYMTLPIDLDREKCFLYLKETIIQRKTGRMCGICGMRFKTAMGLKWHVKTHIQANRGAKSRFPPTHINLIKLKLKCPCGKYFNDLDEFSSHRKNLLTGSACSIAPTGEFVGPLKRLQPYKFNTV